LDIHHLIENFPAHLVVMTVNFAQLIETGSVKIEAR
jgi:hypothetical protein